MKIDWHPYPEETPSKYKRYLITIPSDVKDEGVYVTITYWDAVNEYFHTPSIYDPIAWAELPEPYDPKEVKHETE